MFSLFLFVVVVLAVVGVLLYLLNTLVPMDPRIKTAINALVLLGMFVWILQAVFGVFPHGWPHTR